RLYALKCEEDLQKTLRRDAELRELFARHRSFSLWYGEMLARDPEKMAALLNFLEVSPRELTTTTKRLGNNSLRGAIANLDELSTHFEGSRFAEFFENA